MDSVRFPSRPTAALRAGAVAFLATLFSMGFSAAPFVAAAGDFGHSHPVDAPAHVHPVTTLFGAVAPEPLSLLAPIGNAPASAPRAGPAPRLRRAPNRQARPRAPPLHLS